MKKENTPNNSQLNMTPEIQKTEEEWKQILTPEQYHICREKGTERAFTGKYYNTKEKGVYKCVACGNELFSSDAKFDSGTGWPSFYSPIDSTKIMTQMDYSYGMTRVEVMCRRCGSHLGHVFEDGPKPTGLRYCINSLSLKLEKNNP
ncbi:MAG: peptide-methionine (R)-S-oxide reductase MsrB [Cytophagaceae bacterium]|nr:peptide-methionine (R)-S-oxide reductase MsrB [Cytophagaceae bacterium]MDW8455513.1 peptide-methionine (R)-S-oxide reductase MsrB [Cytophagaceae bacterium]